MSGAQKYRKRPVVIEAIQYDPPCNCEDVWRFLGWPWPQGNPTLDSYHDESECHVHLPVFIETMEGLTKVSPGDFIIKGIQGEFYPCKPDIFEATYDHYDEAADKASDRGVRA